MSLFVQQIFNGLKVGSVYALVALGYTMVYGIIRLINFAHGDFIMVGAYTLCYTIPLMVNAGMPAWMAVVLGIVVCVIVGVVVELLAYRPVRKKGTNMTALITAISMSLFLQNTAQSLFGSAPKPITTIFDLEPINIAGVSIAGETLVTILIGFAVMITLTVVVNKTKIGRSMRAVSQDRQAAILTGVNVNRTITLTFAIGAALAALAALMYCANYPAASPTMGGMLGLKAFVAAVLGGIGIIPGAMLGGILVGLVESLSKAYSAVLTGGIITSAFSDAVVFMILIFVLLIRPAGILGKNEREKV
ncbi:MAG: branched-chain amino acid ABC transporter permease [Eubacteriaceae bacterium]|nr:branched-chain amino acid ABC transporter permease [Eubacteriaceae bacterium]